MITSETDVHHHASQTVPVALGASFIALIVVLGFAYDHGRARQDSAMSAETAVIEDEDIAFCARLGIAQNSDTFARCKSGLADIRRSQRERIDNAVTGMF
jgi:hypothetical protein